MGHSLGEFEQLILLALLQLGDDAFGVSVQREIEERASRPVSLGSVYTALIRLEAKGYVTSREGEPTAQRGGRRKKLYRVQPAGQRALSRALAAIREMSRGLEPRLELR